MSLTSQKIAFGRSLNRTIENTATDALQVLGQELPAEVVSINGKIVTVKFDIVSGYSLPNVTIPIIGSEYLREPIQPGCRGIVISVDAQIGRISGLGAQGYIGLVQPGNLSALVFVPVGNTNFFPVPSDQAVLYGSNGAILATANKDGFTDTKFDLTVNGITITIRDDAAITIGNVTITNNDVTVNGVSLFSHIHGGVQTGSGDTGVPIA